MRPLPQLTPANEWFWTSGADGRLRIQGCDDCGTLVHPPVPICPACRSRAWTPSVVSGPRHRRRRSPSTTTSGCRTSSRRTRSPTSALAEDPTVHLTTNIVGCDPDDVHIGQEVTVRFEQHEDVWLPLFEPTGATDEPVDRSPNPSARRRVRRSSDDRFEHRAVLSGVGRSAIGRRLMVDPLSLTVDACLAAVADAGLDARRHRRAVHLPGRRRAWA